MGERKPSESRARQRDDTTFTVRTARKLWRAIAPPALQARLDHIHYDDAGHGYDPLGLQPDSVALSTAAARFVYEKYFRVVSHGIENIPKKSAAILACNHSGLIPIDGVMIVNDIIRHTNPTRVPRAVGDMFIPLLPFVGNSLSRMGMVSGSEGNFRYLLEHGELALIFPEGVPGISKGFKKRYQLQEWRVGHTEFAIRYQAPVVPVGVVGAEEAWIQIAKLDLKLFGAPFLPLPLTLLPMPVKMHIHYGEPIDFSKRWKPSDADDPEVTEEAAQIVKQAVENLLAKGLEERKGWFR